MQMKKWLKMYLIKNSLWQFFGHCLHQSTIFWLFFNNFIKNVKKCRYLLSDFNQLLQKEKVEKPQDGNQFSPFIYNLSFVVAIRDFNKRIFFRSQDARSNDSATSCQVSWSYLIEFFWLSSNNFYTLQK